MSQIKDGYQLVMAMSAVMFTLVLLIMIAGRAVPNAEPMARDTVLSVETEAQNSSVSQPVVTPQPTPEIELTALPVVEPQDPELAYLKSASKTRFVERLLPLIEAENAKLLADRAKATGLLASESWYDPWLVLQFQKYRVELSDELIATLKAQGPLSAEAHAMLEDHADDLLQRIDIIPPSLVLSQSANESAWGRSRFAQEGNNYFGQWCFSEGCGIVPAGRPEGETYEVRSFDSIDASVESYALNLNRHWAYERLRDLREQQRRLGRPITGVHLAGGLEKYSARGLDYIDELRSMIWVNDFDQLD